MKELTLKGTISSEYDDEIVYCYELRQVKDLKWVDLSYGDDILYISIKKREILDEIEKEYLRAVIKPFRDRVKYIEKNESFKNEYIGIYFEKDIMLFPCFKKGTMYEGMKKYKKYTLEELGL